MNYIDWFSSRLTKLRFEKGVSAREMSLSLGQSESYINKIENGRALPSMAGFFAICEYLEIEPVDFFDSSLSYPKQLRTLLDSSKELNETQLSHIQQIVDDLLDK